MASVTFSHWQPSRPRRGGSVFRVPAPARTLLKVGAAAIVLLAVVESGLRVTEYYFEQPVGFAAQMVRLPSGAVVNGRTVNALGYVDEEFDDQPLDGKVRIALLGGRATLAGDAATNLAVQLESLLPGVDVNHFGLPEGNPRRYAAQLKSDVFPSRPHFVLLCLSPADDVATTAEMPSPFDVRLLQLTSRWLSATSVGDSTDALRRLTETLDYETYVRRRTTPIRLCRNDDDVALVGRWKAAQTSLTRMVERCREREIGFGIILLPSEFQLNPALADALRRRAGIESDRFDVDLPQRRCTALADHLQLATLDLLPTFRSAGTVLYEASSPDWNAAGRTLAAETTARWLQHRLGTAVAASGAQ